MITADKVREIVGQLFQVADPAVSAVRSMVPDLSCKGVGCHWCCYDQAIVTLPEAVAMARAVELLPDEQREATLDRLRNWLRVMREAGELAGLFRDGSKQDFDVWEAAMKRERDVAMQNRLPCPLLVDKKCSVYEDRPFACRAHMASGTPPEACATSGDAETVFAPQMNVMFMQSLQRTFSEIKPLGSIPMLLADLLEVSDE